VESRSLLAFLIAFGASLVLTPLMRYIALASGILDRPAARKFHTRDVPYMGGIAIAGAALVGFLVRPDAAPRIGFLALVAVLLGIVGLLDDDRTLPVRPRLFTQFAAAIAAVAVGVRAHPTGIAAYDIVITVGFIVAMTNAMNLLDNMDGLAGGIGASVAASVFALATFGGQDVVSSLAAGICGACIGFLAFNWRPASIFMGDAGALFLGFALSVAVLELRPVVDAPGTFAVQVLLLGLPVLDTCTVIFSRLRRGISVAQGGRDHLSHRLVALGLSPGIAVAVLMAVQLVLGALAVFAGRGVLWIPWALIAAVLVCSLLAIVCSRPQVYRRPIVGLPRPVRLVFATTLASFAIVTVIAVVAALAIRRDVDRARTDVQRALSALRAGETADARAAFADAGKAFRSADGVLGFPLTYALGVVPVVSPNVAAARKIVSTGESLADAGSRLATGVDPKRFEVVRGTVPIREVERVSPELTAAAQLLRDSRKRLSTIDQTYLMPIMANAIDELQTKLRDAQTDADRVELAARVVPDVFGGHGTRRYFLAVQNSAELRATGGFIGNWGILVADHGHVRLDQFDRISTLNEGGDPRARLLRAPDEFLKRYERFGIAQTWQNVNMSPDFPTVGRVIQNLLPESGGPKVDGVIAVDSSGLAALLQLTGPVTVPGWPEPITADNVVDVTLRDAYARFANREDRAEFLGKVARAVWSEATTSKLGSPAHIGDALGSAAGDRHLMVWLAKPDEQKVADAIGASGRIATARGDSLLVVTQNAAGNKADYYLDRSTELTATLTPDHAVRNASVRSRISVELHNGAPASGLSQEVIGPYDARFRAGENRSFVSVYTPGDFHGARVDGRPAALESARELERNVYSSFVSAAAGGTAKIAFDVTSRVQLVDGWYRLDVLKQPTLRPDNLEVTIQVPSGWRIAEVLGRDAHIDPSDGRRATVARAVTSEYTLGVRVVPVGGPGILDRLRAGN
jgi:UDP-GlcNAc:undecaprenyl-phosphate GlcNAc-1-phosphate transferase